MVFGTKVQPLASSSSKEKLKKNADQSNELIGQHSVFISMTNDDAEDGMAVSQRGVTNTMPSCNPIDHGYRITRIIGIGKQ